MDPFSMVVGIVLIVTVGTIIRTKLRLRSHNPADEAETLRMRDEIKTLRDRVAVLERIATDREHSLEREIELLRDR